MEWKGIPGWPEYQVSDEGSVRRARRGNNWPEGKVLQPNLANGYLNIHLYRDSKCHVYGVHALMCLAFRGPRPTPNHQVAHYNGDKTDNRIANLRWALPIENAADKRRHRTMACGAKMMKSDLNDADVLLIRRLYRRRSQSNSAKLSDQFGVTQKTIFDIVKRRTWNHLYQGDLP